MIPEIQRSKVVGLNDVYLRCILKVPQNQLVLEPILSYTFQMATRNDFGKRHGMLVSLNFKKITNHVVTQMLSMEKESILLVLCEKEMLTFNIVFRMIRAFEDTDQSIIDCGVLKKRITNLA